LAGGVVRTDDMDDPVRLEVAPGRPARLTGRESVGEPLDAVAQDRRSAGGMDRAVDATSTAHRTVRGVDDGIDVLRGDVTAQHVHLMGHPTTPTTAPDRRPVSHQPTKHRPR